MPAKPVLHEARAAAGGSGIRGERHRHGLAGRHAVSYRPADECENLVASSPGGLILLLAEQLGE
jgi:hypothetical protein